MSALTRFGERRTDQSSSFLTTPIRQSYSITESAVARVHKAR